MFATALPAGHFRPPRFVFGHFCSAEFIDIAAARAELPVLRGLGEGALRGPQAAYDLLQGGAVEGRVVHQKTWRTPGKPLRTGTNCSSQIS